MDPSVVDSDFGWSTIGGRVDSNGNGMIDGSDDTLGLIGSTVDEGFGDPTDGADILASSICLFGCLHHPSAHGIIIAPALDGLVDLNSDGTITAADTCTGCFFGRDLVSGFVTTPDGGGGGGGGTPSPTPPPVVVHARTAPLTLTRHLIAEGTVHVADGTLECAANVTVLIQRWVHGHWRTVKTTVTDANGAFRVHLPDHVGKYRVKVPRVTLPSGDVCAGATSPSVWNHH